MPALSHNLQIEQGATWSQGFLPKLGAPGATAPFLDGTWAVKAQVRTSVESDDVLYEWSTVIGNAAVVSQAAVLYVTPAVSSDWDWSTGHYDCEVSKGAVTYRIAEGRVRVLPETTR